MPAAIRFILASALSAACSAMASAQALSAEPPATAPPAEGFLTIGDRAPDLDAAHWLRGEEIAYLEPGRIHVLLFWSTWCKFCQASFPALSDVQESHANDGVTVVAISDEKLQTVFEFLSQPERAEQARFAIATDPDLSVQRRYMEAAAIGDIPTVFLVGRDGAIEWIGHPSELEAPLESVLLGTWNRDAFKVEFEERMAPSRGRYLRMREMKAAYEAREWDRLLEMFDRAIATDERPEPLKLQRFLLMIGEMGESEAGYLYGRTLLREFWDNAFFLNQLAWVVVDHETVLVRDLAFARKAAERACDLTSHENSAVLDTLARVYYEEGDLRGALDWQSRAIKHLQPEDPFAAGIRAAMTRYEEEARAQGIVDDVVNQ
jgi:thiol-disulfide isomerase/thioredoxin